MQPKLNIYAGNVSNQRPVASIPLDKKEQIEKICEAAVIVRTYKDELTAVFYTRKDAQSAISTSQKKVAA